MASPEIVVDRDTGIVFAMAPLSNGGGAWVWWNGNSWVFAPAWKYWEDPDASIDEGLARSLIGDGPVDTLKAGFAPGSIKAGPAPPGPLP
jgi:hypothetical protein